jgi:hypothetical protein
VRNTEREHDRGGGAFHVGNQEQGMRRFHGTRDVCRHDVRRHFPRLRRPAAAQLPGAIFKLGQNDPQTALTALPALFKLPPKKFTNDFADRQTIATTGSLG